MNHHATILSAFLTADSHFFSMFLIAYNLSSTYIAISRVKILLKETKLAPNDALSPVFDACALTSYILTVALAIKAIRCLLFFPFLFSRRIRLILYWPPTTRERFCNINHRIPSSSFIRLCKPTRSEIPPSHPDKWIYTVDRRAARRQSVGHFFLASISISGEHLVYQYIYYIHHEVPAPAKWPHNKYIYVKALSLAKTWISAIWKHMHLLALLINIYIF